MIFYNAKAPAAALSSIAGQPVRLDHDERGFRVVLPDGHDPAEGEPEAWTAYSKEPQPDTKAVAGWEPEQNLPEKNPVTDVEMRVGEMQANRATASLKTDAIKARILQALVDGGMDESQGKGLGIAIIKDHFQALVTFEIGGGGATASQVLYADLAADHRLAPFLSIISDVLGVSGRIK